MHKSRTTRCTEETVFIGARRENRGCPAWVAFGHSVAEWLVDFWPTAASLHQFLPQTRIYNLRHCVRGNYQLLKDSWACAAAAIVSANDTAG